MFLGGSVWVSRAMLWDALRLIRVGLVLLVERRYTCYMNAELKEVKIDIRNWIARFSDQRLSEVYAFNADGQMEFAHPCRCLLGVTLGAPHQDCAGGHYDIALELPAAVAAEDAYDLLGFIGVQVDSEAEANDVRRRRLSPILRGEMRRRDKLKATHLYQRKRTDTDELKSHREFVSA